MKHVDPRLEGINAHDLQSVPPCLLGVPQELVNVVGGVGIGLVVNPEVVGLARLPSERRVRQNDEGKPHRVVRRGDTLPAPAG